MKIIEYLKNHTLEQLFEEYAIKAVQSKKYPELYLLKYTIKSPMHEQICQECRSLIINIDTLEIVSHPYHKFFNYGDERAHKIDWETAEIYEKLDGSIMILYYYKGKWNVSTSGLPDADGKINDLTDKTFADVFWEIWNKSGYKLPNQHKNFTFMFEMMSKYNKIVCEYDTEKIVLHGLRNNIDGCEHIVNDFYNKLYNWEIVKQYGFYKLEDILKMVNERPAKYFEGFVVCDINFNRIKIKSEEYFNLHHIKSGLNYKKNILNLVRNHERKYIVKKFPEFEEEINLIGMKYHLARMVINRAYLEHKNIKSQKEFALAIQKYKSKAVLFQMRKHKLDDCTEILKTMRIEHLMKFLGINNE